MSFFDNVANVATNISTLGNVGYNGGFDSGALTNAILGGSGPGGGLFGGSNSGGLLGQITGPIAEALGKIGAPIAQGITSGFSSAYDSSKNKWQQEQLAKLPNIDATAYPGFDKIADGSGNLPSQFNVNPNMDALTQARSYATAQGPSPWASMATANLDAKLPGQQAFQASQIGGANEQAKNGLMSEGGLTGAASGRLDQKANLATMLGNQNLNQQNITDKQTIGTTDQEQKDSMLQALPSLENTALQPQQFNIQNALGQHQDANQADLERYKQEMSSWAAANTGQAISQSGKK